MVQRVLLTGAGGFIGRGLPAMLMAQGYEVHAIGRTRPDAPVHGCVWHSIDLLSQGGWDKDIARIGATGLIHLAWCPDQSAHLESPQNTAWVAASMRLARAFAAGGGRRLIVGGSCAEYQWSDDSPTLEETSALLAPATLYGKSKLALHQSLMEGGLDISVAWARIFIPYGPHDYVRRLISQVTFSLLQGREVACSEGRQVLDFIYVEDVAAALAHLMTSSFEGAVNLGTGEGHSVREAVELVVQNIGRPELVRFGARAAGAIQVRRLVADTRRLRGDVGFAPRYSLIQGVAATVAWARRQSEN